MLKKLLWFSMTFCLLFSFYGCKKDDTTNPDPNNPGNTNLPFIEYKIGSSTVRVDCNEISFEAQAGETFTGVHATSQSTKLSFTFSFPSFAGDVDQLPTGAYPVKSYSGISYDTIPFHFSLKAPKTSGGNDYYVSITPSSSAHRNQVSKIEKGDIVNGKRVYWITGQYTLPARNAANDTINISGNYRFRLNTLLTASVVLPAISTVAVSDTTASGAKVSGNVTAVGNGVVTARGVCWSTLTVPTTIDSKTTNGAGAGTFTATLTGLEPVKTYFVRAYATNSLGTAYGNELEFTTRANLPTVVSSSVTRNKPYYAEVTADVSGDAASGVQDAGICWSTTANPTITNRRTTDQQFGGPFIGRLIALLPNTTYHARAFAINSAGIVYGADHAFTTPVFPYSSVTDRDGNVYKTIVIGSQTWMVENLKTSRYRNGDVIPNVTGNNLWDSLKTGGYCYYNNSATNNNIYGKLYNWYTVLDARGLAPAGWHIPTHTDITILHSYLTSGTVRPFSMLEAGTSHWAAPNDFATNETGFTGLPGGERHAGSFNNQGQSGKFWLNEIFAPGIADFFSLHGTDDVSGDVDAMSTGFSVRCLKN